MNDIDNVSTSAILRKKRVKFFIYVCIFCAATASVLSFSVHNRIQEKFLSTRNLTTSIPNMTTSIPQKLLSTPKKRNCTVILHNPLGRLGNVLFEFASAYGLSLQHSCRLYLGPRLIEELSQYFDIHVTDLLTEAQLKSISSIQHLYNHCTYFPELLQSNKSEHVELTGYWQAQKHFANQTDQIRAQLRFKQTVVEPVKNFLQTNVSDNSSQLIGIHIRRGDFIGQRRVSPDQFIFNAMNYFQKKYSRTKFIFTSDDKNYCREKFGGRNNTYFTPNSFNPAQDMALLTLCHHIIITVGTYGWWGAYLLQNQSGEIITDSKPNHDPLDVDCKASVFFPPWFKFLNGTS